MHGGPAHALQQIMIALLAGERLDQHEHPGEATVQVLHGRVRLAAGGSTSEGAAGNLLIPSAAVHRLEALEDAVVLLPVAARARQTASEPGA
jgi:quercetin dioxygenase-like cupin family protein